MVIRDFYVFKDFNFIGGYCKPDHVSVCENVDEVYYEELLYKKDDNHFINVINRWNFFGEYCRVDQLIFHLNRADALKFIDDYSWFSNWTNCIETLMYDVGLDFENVHLSILEVE